MESHVMVMGTCCSAWGMKQNPSSFSTKNKQTKGLTVKNHYFLVQYKKRPEVQASVLPDVEG